MTTQQPRPTGRLSRSARRAQLLGVARTVFTTQGFHAASMDEIAEGAGVSKPVLYQHFSSKLALYQALLTDSATALERLVRAAIGSTDDNAERVQRAVAAYFEFITDEDQGYRLIFESDLRDEPETAAIVAEVTAACVNAITETIMVDTGADAASAELLAAGLVGISQVGARYWRTQSDPIGRQRAVELLSALAWRGISHFPRRQEASNRES